MVYRTLINTIAKAVITFPAIVVTGPRQSGKTTLWNNIFAESHRFVSLFIGIFLLSGFLAANVLAYESPGAPSGFVNDFADILTQAEEDQLEASLTAFEKESSNEIAVVMIASVGEDTIENFAVELFEEWGIGKQKNDNGVLLLIARDDRQMRIEVGYGLEGALTDAQSYWIIKNELTPAFQDGNFYQGIDAGVGQIMKATRGEYVPAEENAAVGQSPFENAMTFVFIFVFLFINVLATALGRSKSWWLGGVMGAMAGIIVGVIVASILLGAILAVIFGILGLIFDYLVSKNWPRGGGGFHRGGFWRGGGFGGGLGGGFGGFGGGRSGGGGATGRW